MVLLDVDKIHGFGRRFQGIEAAVDLVSLEFASLVDDKSLRGAAGMTPLKQLKASGHDATHLAAREKWIIPLDANVVSVIGDELKTGSVGIEDLAAAGDEAI